MAVMTRGRISEIAAVRGLALAGLPLVNLMGTVGEQRYPNPDAVSSFIYDNLVYQRFLTIFCFLFGLSFALILDTAGGRTARPRLVLARRLVALFAISMVQLFALDGNLQLAVYAVPGLVVLLPLSHLPRRGQLVVGLLLLIASMPIIEIDPQHAGIPLKVLLDGAACSPSAALAVATNLLRFDLANMLGSRRSPHSDEWP